MTSGKCLFSATEYMLMRQSTELLDVHTFSTRKCPAARLKLDHGVLAVDHGILLHVCPYQRVQLDHGVLADGPGPLMAFKTGVRTATCVVVLAGGSLARGHGGREWSCPYAAYGSTCSIVKFACVPSWWHCRFPGCDH